MVREKAIAKDIGRGEEFRWRGHEITRIEGLSDAVFAFAVTLLVVSLEVPKTFTELAETMHGFGAFLVSFLLLFASQLRHRPGFATHRRHWRLRGRASRVWLTC
jgi:uncharacterized membrane protein